MLGVPWGCAGTAEADLVTSLVRQFRTYEGHAALFTDDVRSWFSLSFPSKDGVQLDCSDTPENAVRAFAEDWQIDPDQFTEIITDLNLKQSAEFVNRSGRRLRLWVDPKERRLSIDQIAAETAAP